MKKKVGFTVVELLIVIIIITILSVIAFPHFISAQDRGKQSQTVANLRTIAVILAQYYVDRDRYPTVAGIDELRAELIVNGYTKSLPTKDGWSQNFGYAFYEDGLSYSLWSCGKGRDVISCDVVEETRGETNSFSEQIVITDGHFTQYPVGQQSE